MILSEEEFYEWVGGARGERQTPTSPSTPTGMSSEEFYDWVGAPSAPRRRSPDRPHYLDDPDLKMNRLGDRLQAMEGVLPEHWARKIQDARGPERSAIIDQAEYFMEGAAAGKQRAVKAGLTSVEQLQLEEAEAEDQSVPSILGEEVWRGTKDATLNTLMGAKDLVLSHAAPIIGRSRADALDWLSDDYTRRATEASWHRGVVEAQTKDTFGLGMTAKGAAALGGMVPSIGIGVLTAGRGFVPAMITQASLTSYREVLEEGGTEWEAIQVGFVTGVSEYATMKLGSFLAGKFGFVTTEEAVAKMLGKGAISAAKFAGSGVAKAMMTGTKIAVGGVVEGAEEVASDTLVRTFKVLRGIDPEAMKNWKKENWDNFMVGTMLGVGFSTANAATQPFKERATRAAAKKAGIEDEFARTTAQRQALRKAALKTEDIINKSASQEESHWQPPDAQAWREDEAVLQNALDWAMPSARGKVTAYPSAGMFAVDFKAGSVLVEPVDAIKLSEKDVESHLKKNDLKKTEANRKLIRDGAAASYRLKGADGTVYDTLGLIRLKDGMKLPLDEALANEMKHMAVQTKLISEEELAEWAKKYAPKAKTIKQQEEAFAKSKSSPPFGIDELPPLLPKLGDFRKWIDQLLKFLGVIPHLERDLEGRLASWSGEAESDATVYTSQTDPQRFDETQQPEPDATVDETQQPEGPEGWAVGQTAQWMSQGVDMWDDPQEILSFDQHQGEWFAKFEWGYAPVSELSKVATDVDPETDTPPPVQPPPVESTPSEPSHSPFTGIKRERLEMQADKAGLPRPTETEAVKAVDLVTNAVSQLTTESDKAIQALATDVRNTQKSITVEELADLMASVDYHKRKMEEAVDRANEYLANGEQSKAAEEETDVAAHKAALQNAQQAARDVGRRQFAYMGHVLQVLVDRDGAAHIERELLRANLGQREYDDADNDVIAEYAKEIADKLKKAQRKQAQRGKQIDAHESLAEANEKITQLEDELKRDRTRSRKSRGSRNRIVTQEAKDDAVQRIRDRIKKMGSTAHAVPVGPALQMLPDAAIVAGYVLESGSRKLAEFSRDMVAEVGDWVKPHLVSLYQTARGEYARNQQDVLRERLGDADDLRGQHRAVAAMAKEILAETRRDDGSFITRDELLERLHKELKKIDSSITERQTMDLFSGYGKYAELSQDDLEVEYRNRRGEARELGKIEDMKQKHPPKATGREMHTPSNEERQLHRDVRDLKKQGERDGWYYTGDGASRLKGTKEAIKTRLQNEIRDLDSQIDARTKTVKDKTAPLTDDEIDALRVQRNQRKERLDAIVRAVEEADAARWESEGGTFVDPAVEAYLKVLDRQIASLKKQLGTKSVFPKPQPSRPGGQAVDARKSQIESLRAEKELLRNQLDPNYKTNQKVRNAEKAAEREVAKLEKKRDDGFKMREKPDPLPESKRLRKAREKLAALRLERLKELEDEYALRAAIAQSKRNAANLADRISRGDFAPRTRKPARTWDDSAWKEAKAEELALRNEFAEKLAEYEWKNMTQWETTKFYAGRARTLWKAIMTSLDQTQLGLQGGIVMFTNPVVWSKALIPTGKAVSARQRELMDAERESHPDYERYKNYNLAIWEHGAGKDRASLEFYGNDAWIDKIPGVAVSERTFSTFINELRFNLMRVMEWSYTKDGRAMTEQQGKALARVVNAFTLAYKPTDPKIRMTMDVAGEVFWAPSMYVARAQLAVGSPVLWNPGADSRVRMMAAKQYVKAIVGMAAATAVLRLLLGDDDDEVTPVDVDYYKVKSGNIRMDMTSGMGQMATFGMRMLNTVAKARLGVSGWEGRGRTQGARELVGSFASFKVNPWIGAGLDFFSEKDVVGRPTSIANILLSSITPLSVQTVVEAVEEEGVVKGAAWSVPGVTGRNLSIYDRSAPKSEETFLATTKRLVRQIMNQKTPGPRLRP